MCGVPVIMTRSASAENAAAALAALFVDATAKDAALLYPTAAEWFSEF